MDYYLLIGGLKKVTILALKNYYRMGLQLMCWYGT